MENLETLLIWFSLVMAGLLVGLFTIKYRKSRSTQGLIMMIGHVLLAVTLVALLAMRFLN